MGFHVCFRDGKGCATIFGFVVEDALLHEGDVRLLGVLLSDLNVYMVRSTLANSGRFTESTHPNCDQPPSPVTMNSSLFCTVLVCVFCFDLSGLGWEGFKGRGLVT